MALDFRVLFFAYCFCLSRLACRRDTRASQLPFNGGPEPARLICYFNKNTTFKLAVTDCLPNSTGA
ncbi:hypothetical protein GCM10027567_18440 [Spongiibacter taiwanensis]